MIIQANIPAMTASRLYKTNINSSQKTAKKLSSGYRVNTAADDAAVLSISEKMRKQIRGLDAGAENARQGQSWVNIGDGALNEVTDMLHRMSELAINSLNGTLTSQDRAALQAEFDQLQSEIDRISQSTQYNTQQIFEEHEPTYYTLEGNRFWLQSQYHTVTAGNNTLSVQTKKQSADAAETVEITVPPGRYTTQELMDEIDDAFINSGKNEHGVNVEYTLAGTCNLNYEDGEDIVGVAGGLSYLFYDTYDRGSHGALIGTTTFYPGTALTIKENNNDLQFTIEDYAGNSKDISITIPTGNYTREKMIEFLNTKLTGTGVTASTYGDLSIQISGEDYVVTGLKGDMFKIDDPRKEEELSSVFYDNVKYGQISETNAYFKGGAVLTNKANDTEHNRFVINSSNNTLKIRANGSSYTTITLANGSYTAYEMVTMLNQTFAANSLGLNASLFSETSGSNTFFGLQIDSTKKGLESSVDIAANESSAYNTLFKNRTYAEFKTNIPSTNGRYNYVQPTATSGKTLNFPLSLTDTGNEFTFMVQRKSTANSYESYNIKLDAGAYADMDALTAEITKQLNAYPKLKDQITVDGTGNKISFTPASTSDIVNIRVAASGTNTGYKDLFVAETTVKVPNTASSIGNSANAPSISLDLPIGSIIDSTNDKFVIEVDGEKQTVTLNHGLITGANVADIIQSINDQITGYDIYTPKGINASAAGTNKNGNPTGTGTTTPTTFHCTATGSGGGGQGSSGTPGELAPASYVVPKALNASTTISSANNTMNLKINGTMVNIVLDDGTYDRASLAKHIQEKLDEKLPGDMDGVKVELSGSNLKLTTKLSGKFASLDFSNTSGTFLNDLCSTKSNATAKFTNAQVQNSININNTNNTFTFQLNGVDTSITLTPNAAYTRSTLAAEMNKQFKDNGINAIASIDSYGYLQLQNTVAGSGTSIGINTSKMGSFATALYGELATSASCTVGLEVADSITIGSNNNKFSINIDGKLETVELSQKTYSRADLVAELNNKLAGKATVSVKPGTKNLTFTSATKGTGSRINITTPSSINDARAAIFGTNTKHISDITATDDGNGHLVLTGADKGSHSIAVSSNGGSANELFIKSTEKPSTSTPTYTSGIYVAVYANINGANLENNYQIASHNKALSFNYMGKTISFSLDEKDAYSYDDLRQALQDNIDAQAGADELRVTVDSSGVNITAVKPGSQYNLTGFSGGFYTYAINGSKIHKSSQDVKGDKGKQIVDPAYTIGRQDVKNNPVEIKAGANDRLSLNLNIDSATYTLDMVLDAGTYQGSSLINQIQKQLNKALVKAGFQENTIEVNIGGLNSSVIGANDSNSLNFKLSSKLVQSKLGTYSLDAVSGSAAFYVFYKTDGSPIPTYVQGAKDISAGVSITPENKTFSFHADGTDYEYEIPEGNYTAEGLVQALNEQIEADTSAPPIVAMLAGNNLKLSFTKFGKHTLHSISGSAKGDLFYQEKGRIDDNNKINIQLSSNRDDDMEILKPRIGTVALGINSITISRPKYAAKALDRIEKALSTQLASRSYFGATSNRLDHAIANNENTSENTQASESKMRDTDIAAEMITMAKQNILMQVSQSMIAQANQAPSMALRLLQ